MSAAPSFGELRSLVMGSPSADAWEQICALLARWSVSERAEFIPYVRDNTRAWPFELLVNPLSWIERALAGDEVPELSLIRTLLLAGRRRLGESERARIQGALDSSQVCALELRGPVLPRGLLREEFVRGALASARIISFKSVRAELGLGGLGALFDEPQAEGLTALHIERERLDTWGIRALIESDRASNLRRLALVDTMLMSDSLSVLAESEQLAPEEVVLDFNDLSRLTFATPQYFERARSLSLKGCDLSRHGACYALFERMSQLTSLWLDDNGLSAEVVIEMSEAGVFDGVESLSLSGNPIGDSGLKMLLTSMDASALGALDLDGCEIRDEGAVALAECAALESLQILNLGRNLIGERGRRALKRSPHLSEKLWERSPD